MPARPALPATRRAARFGAVSDGIGLRLTLAVAAFSLLVTVLLSALQVFADYGRDVRVAERHVESVSASLQRSLADSLWNLRDDRLRLQLEGVLAVPGVLGAEVWETEAPARSERRVRVQAPPAHGTAPAARVDHVLELPLVHDDRGVERRVGLMRVQSSHARLRERLSQGLLTGLVSQGITTFVIAFFVLFVVHRMVTRHLVTIAEAIGRYDPLHPEPAIRLDRKPPARPDELDRVVATLHSLRATLERTYGDLRDANARLQADIAAREAAERAGREAREAHAAAEAASRAKTEFLSRMSHELRTPMNAILGFAQLMEDEAGEPLPPGQRRRLALIREAGWHLLALIDDLLDLTRIEAGRLALRLGPVALAPLVDAALAITEPHARAAGVQLAGDPAPRAGLAVRADALRLRQVFINLLSNAVKYNRRGGTVRVSVDERGPEVGVEVADDGAGMTPEQLARLFQPFDRLGRESGDVPGTGIGLVITRQLVQLMGGRLEVESAPGRGTRARIALPTATAGESAAGEAGLPEAAPAAAPCGRVLYVEDDAVNRLLMAQFLARWPEVRLTLAETGRAGLEAARVQRPDVVLLDLNLPDLPGEQVLRALRDDPATAGIRVMVLSATAMAQDVDAALAAGAADYVTKPVDFEAFARRLRRLLGGATPPVD